MKGGLKTAKWNAIKKIFNGTILLNVKIKRLIKQYKIKISCSNRREGDYKTFSLQLQLKRCKRLLINIKQRKKKRWLLQETKVNENMHQKDFKYKKTL